MNKGYGADRTEPAGIGPGEYLIEPGEGEGCRLMSKWFRIALLATLCLLGGVVLGIMIGVSIFRPDPPNYDDPTNWIIIRSFTGELSSGDGVTNVMVGALQRYSDGKYLYTVLQNKITVTAGDVDHAFYWSDDRDYVAGEADIRDVDGDGTREILLWGGGHVRVVEYLDGRFEFRPDRDDLESNFLNGPVDIDADGKIEFQGSKAFFGSDAPGIKPVEVPLMMRWSRTNGFQDRSNEFQGYYREKVIPQLTRKIEGKQDEVLSKAVSSAIDYIKSNILERGRPKPKM